MRLLIPFVVMGFVLLILFACAVPHQLHYDPNLAFGVGQVMKNSESK